MFCKNCGGKINDGESFCSKCGTPIATANANAEQQTATPSDTSSVSKKEQKIDKVVDGIGCGFAGIYMIFVIIAAIVGVLIVVALIIVGVRYVKHGKLDTKEVQEAYLEDYDNMTIGEAFGDYAYFSDGSWSEDTIQYLGKKTDVVIYSTTIELYDSYSYTCIEEPISVQFKRNDSFDIEVLRIICSKSDFFDYNEDAVIESVYQDEMVVVDTSSIVYNWN